MSVFHYIQMLQRPLDIKVEMMNGDHAFEFIEAKFDQNRVCQKTPSDDDSETKTIKVKFETGSSTFFLIRSLVQGQIKIHVKASFLDYKDEIEKYLIVESETFTHYKNDVQLKEHFDEQFSLHFDVKIPEEAIQPSIKVEAKVVGDLLPPVFINVEAVM